MTEGGAKAGIQSNVSTLHKLQGENVAVFVSCC